MPARPPIDRGIIFSAPMVRAILAGQKTQTRRLASSPLALMLPGDRLWVRETMVINRDGVRYRADPGTPVYAYEITNHAYHPGRDFWIKNARADDVARGWPSIHMPRWASRISLTVTDVRFEPVDQISEADARAEGIACENMIVGSHCAGGRHSEITADRYFSPHLPDDEQGFECAADAFAALWDSLHDQDGERFAEAPPIVALTFAATLANIDSTKP